MNKTSDAVGVVMLGGASSRMGSDKSELSVGGQTLTQIAFDTLEKAGLKNVLISSGDKSHGIQDQVSGKGPLGGMHAVMKQASSTAASGFIFLPVDMPLVTTALIKVLADSGFASASVCQFKDWPMPCYFPNTARVLETLEQALSENELAVKYLLKTLNAVELAWQEFHQDVFTNINTPEQWLTHKKLIKTNVDRGL